MPKNDIVLLNNGDGTFDWKFGVNDLVDARGVDRIRSAVIHRILLRTGELEQSVYQGSTGVLGGLLKSVSADNKELVREALEYAVSGVDGVSEARVVLADSVDVVSVTGVFVVLDNGNEVRVL